VTPIAKRAKLVVSSIIDLADPEMVTSSNHGNPVEIVTIEEVLDPIRRRIGENI
jgi:hypothetical protein